MFTSTDKLERDEKERKHAEEQADEDKRTSIEPDRSSNMSGGEADPYAMPYTEPRNSPVYRRWRRLQYQRGLRNLVIAILLFGGLAIAYLVLLGN